MVGDLRSAHGEGTCGCEGQLRVGQGRFLRGEVDKLGTNRPSTHCLLNFFLARAEGRSYSPVYAARSA